MSIITVSREFGSGGREVGKRLADILGYSYYDREIVSEIAKKTKLDENYVAHSLEKGNLGHLPINFGRTFSYPSVIMTDAVNLFSEQHKIIKELAQKGNCVIVGRAADVILKNYNPIKLFVYADKKSKLARCRERGASNENISDKALEKEIKKIDEQRAKYHELFSDIDWGKKEGYHLCVNTTDRDIKELAISLAEYVKFLMK